MEQKTFDKLRQIVYEHSGISLQSNKEALVSARVAKRMRSLGLPDHEAYLKTLLSDNSGKELVELLDVISTNVTSFFREAEHFEFLSNTVAEWLKQGQRRFRFWSAASSTGEEPYTMALTLYEAFRQYDVDWKILATDISTNVLRKAQAGIYTPDKVKTMPRATLDAHFELVGSDDGTVLHRVKDHLRKRVVFKRLNLAEPPFPMHGPLDVVFCRNVMIYFDDKVRIRLLENIHRLLRPGGFLLVGHAESLTGMVSNLRAVKPSIYTA